MQPDGAGIVAILYVILFALYALWDPSALSVSGVTNLSNNAAPFEVGSPAHVTLYDPSASGVFDAGRLHGMSRNSPYLGRELPGRVVAKRTESRGVWPVM